MGHALHSALCNGGGECVCSLRLELFLPQRWKVGADRALSQVLGSAVMWGSLAGGGGAPAVGAPPPSILQWAQLTFGLAVLHV